MKVIIFGAGTLAKLAFYYLTQEMNLKVYGFVIDKRSSIEKTPSSLFERPVHIWEDFIDLYSQDDVKIFLAIAYKSMRNRSSTFEKLKKHKFEFINIISKSASVSDNSLLGTNNFIMPGVVLEPGTAIGSNNILWSNTTICHDSKIGNHNFFGANFTMGGFSKIGNLCFFGFSSTITDQITVSDEVLLAANSFLNSSPKKLTRLQGIPAKEYSEIDPDTGINFS